MVRGALISRVCGMAGPQAHPFHELGWEGDVDDRGAPGGGARGGGSVGAGGGDGWGGSGAG